MTLRPYLSEADFPVIREWISDARAHALWCANRFAYPLTQENFDAELSAHAVRWGDIPFAAADADSRTVGFFCYALNRQDNTGMLRFVIVDPSERGTGTAKEMLRLALQFAFEITGADAVHLNVFPENPAAKRCYAHLGFTARETVPCAFWFGDETWSRCNMILPKDTYLQSDQRSKAV